MRVVKCVCVFLSQRNFNTMFPSFSNLVYVISICHEKKQFVLCNESKNMYCEPKPPYFTTYLNRISHRSINKFKRIRSFLFASSKNTFVKQTPFQLFLIFISPAHLLLHRKIDRVGISNGLWNWEPSFSLWIK